MQAEQALYEGSPVYGLPASLLEPEGRTFAVIALMSRQAGLNRERRRDLQNGTKISNALVERLDRTIPKTEMGVLSYYLDPKKRFESFWHAVKCMLDLRGQKGNLAYALAVDIQLLNAYEKEWLELTLDEQVLSETCSKWNFIRKTIEPVTASKHGKNPLGLFMLWPRITDDLKRWVEFDAGTRIKIAHAVFALSSVSLSDWFIRETLNICPELLSELGALLCQPSDALTQSAPNSDLDCSVMQASLAQNGVNPPHSSIDWHALLVRLDEISAELKSHPTQEAVIDLATVVRILESQCAALPRRAPPVAEQMTTQLKALLSHLRSLVHRAEFQWLDNELITQIEARWQLAIRVHGAPAQLDELVADAVAAIQRCDSVAAELIDTFQALEHSQSAVLDANVLLEKARSFGDQAAGKRKRSEALKQQLETEAQQQAQQENLIDAASPFAEPFDYSTNYYGLLADTFSSAAPSGEDAHPPFLPDDPILPAAATTPEREINKQVGSPAEPVPCADSGSTPKPETANLAAQVFQQAFEGAAIEPALGMANAAWSMSAEQEAPADNLPYNDAAGQVCRPIWQLLSCGQPAMAFHAADWISKTSPDTKIPPLDLLAAVALESSLMLPDGGIQLALSSRFTCLLPQDFAAETPKTWHAAINLLLASATLRAMVLAPGTGASTVAAYLHHDGNYPALYKLVQQLRDLSPRLMGFRVEPALLRQARGETAIRDDLRALQHAAVDWLRVQAPAYTIKFAAATRVWQQWLRHGGAIHELVTPVVHNQITEAGRVREQLAAMSDHEHVLRLIHDTDRKTLARRRGEDIHSGARDHLLRNVEEALKLPRQWLGLQELLGHHGSQMRTLLEQVHTQLRESRCAIEEELLRPAPHDPWGLVQAGQAQALRTMRGVLALFNPKTDLPLTEPLPAEVLGRPLLLISDLPVKEDWNGDLQPPDALDALERWLAKPLTAEQAAPLRLERGDVLGADLMVQTNMIAPQTVPIRIERERWKQTLRKEIAECRRCVEVGSAYGYLVEADRRQKESQLALWEAQLEEVRRFDLAMSEIRELRAEVDQARAARAQKVRDAMNGIAITPDMQPTAAAVEQALNNGDITTANELLQWLRQGLHAPTDLVGDSQEGFERFFPATMQAVEQWLEGQRRDSIERTLKQGQAILGMGAQRIPGAQREQAAKLFAAWLDMKSQQNAEQQKLTLLMTGLGFTVKSVMRTEKVAGREVWALDTQAIDDRHICPVPMFGSAACGKYRMVCVWGRPTEDELLQWVGDSTASRPTLLLYFGRMTEKKWRELSRLSKTKRRAFTPLDESLLFYLCHADGSRLRAWFDAALPFAFSSPYDSTAGLVPPEMFYGRGAELDAVRGLNGRCFIYGGRQLGKTALLKRAEQSFHAPTHGHYAKWIDLRAEGIGVSRAASELWITLHEKLKDLGVLDTRIAAPVPGKKQGGEDVIRGLRDFLTPESDRRVLLLLDEADRFFEQDGRDDFQNTRRLKQLMDETGRRFKVVFAGLHNVLRMTERPNHPLAHFGEPIEIGPLLEDKEVGEAVDLIRRPMAAAGFKFESRALVIRILAQTNYYPSLIQLYCSHLLRHMLSQVGSKQRSNGPCYVVTDHDIEQVYSSEALREEIRAKFSLTLQLDPRYEVVAYAMALDVLKNRYSQNNGMPWQSIRQAGAMHWWPEGFRDTSDLDFRVLLDEMVGLGVLRRLPGGRYELRNPNILLLLGNQEEIEAVLIKDREPAVEFESASFRPSLRQAPDAAERNVFTYQQLSQLLRRENSITVVTGTPAAGIGDLAASLADYLGKDAAPVLLSDCTDCQTFGSALSAALVAREKDLVTAFVVPETSPWTEQWISEARQRLERLKSDSKFASVVFVAEPATLWRLLDNESGYDNGQLPWMSLLPWRDEFIRLWLDERQLHLSTEDRRRMIQATGCWPELLMALAGDCTESRALRERLSCVNERCFSAPEDLGRWRDRFGLQVTEPAQVIDLLAKLGEPVEVSELAAVGEIAIKRVRASLRWGELLGLTRSEGADFWKVDPIASKVLLGVQG